MRHILILGAGTAGTVMANRLSRRLRSQLRAGRINITVIDPDPTHLYQPGLLFIPFQESFRERITRDRAPTLDRDVRLVAAEIAAMDPDHDTVTLADGTVMSYDLCIVATGARLVPEETEGMMGPGWRESVHEFYSLEGAEKLGYALHCFVGGKLVINVVEMPIKCPVAPLEFAFLADAYFTNCGIRDKVEITYATPLDGAFTKPTAAQSLSYLLEQKGIRLETEFNTGRIETTSPAWETAATSTEPRPPAGELVSWDERRIPFDLLVTVPVHKGAAFIATAAGLGDAMDFVMVDPHTLQSQRKANIFALGDAANCPTSKAGSVAHFQAEVLEENIVRMLDGRALEPGFDGHANCFIETGHRKALLIDFNYDTEPLPGMFPYAWGPVPLLKESRLNHLGKLAFRHAYWNRLLPGRDFPGIEAQMKRSGKRMPAAVGS
ncbi:MAG: oxidoreductase [Gemmatimonas sp.]|nr:oxidoreductase [Gemmatimonas sp.]